MNKYVGVEKFNKQVINGGRSPARTRELGVQGFLDR